MATVFIPSDVNSAAGVAFAGPISAPNYNPTGIGAFEAAAYAAGMYFYTDLLGLETLQVRNNGTGSFGWGLPTNTVPFATGYTNAFVGGHPGILYVSTGGLADRGQVELTNTSGFNQLQMFITTPTISFYYYFATPMTLSTSSDRYVLSIGPANGVSGTAGMHDGFYLGYTDNVNSGKWALYDGGNQLIANSSVAPVPGTWNDLIITKSGTATISANLNGVQIASGTSNVLNSTTAIPMGLCGIQLIRNTFTSGTNYLLLDRFAIYQAPGTRT